MEKDIEPAPLETVPSEFKSALLLMKKLKWSAQFVSELEDGREWLFKESIEDAAWFNDPVFNEMCDAEVKSSDLEITCPRGSGECYTCLEIMGEPDGCDACPSDLNGE
jgi:hypothetical protein